MTAGIVSRVIAGAARSSKLESAVTRWRPTKSIVSRFVAGSERADAIRIARSLIESGCAVSIDYLGEDTLTAERAAAVGAECLALIDQLGEFATDTAVPSVEVSVKLSALGIGLPQGDSLARSHLTKICRIASDRHVWVTVDAERLETALATQQVVADVREEYPTLGIAVQAYSRNAEHVLHALASPESRIRLCKGAYAESAADAFVDRGEVSSSYLRCMALLSATHGYPMIATHDPALIGRASATLIGRPFEFQMLYGVRRSEQERLIAAGYAVRVYVPYGEQWYGYLMRRLAERPANLQFFLRAALTRS